MITIAGVTLALAALTWGAVHLALGGKPLRSIMREDDGVHEDWLGDRWVTRGGVRYDAEADRLAGAPGEDPWSCDDSDPDGRS